MATLRFDPADVRRVIDHAKNAPEHREYFGEKLGPNALLVKDEGIYLMSNGLPRDVPPDAPEGTTSFVAYAKGFDPTKRDRGAVWDDAREAGGGDDFSEPVELVALEGALTPAPGYEVVDVIIKLTPDSVTIQSAERRLVRQ